MPSLHTPDQFKTRRSRIWMGIIGLVLMYLLATRALDTGSWWQYLGTLLLLILSIRLIIRGSKSKK